MYGGWWLLFIAGAADAIALMFSYACEISPPRPQRPLERAKPQLRKGGLSETVQTSIFKTDRDDRI